jgi:hypothetical protein
MTVRINLCDGFGDIATEDRTWIVGTLEAVRDRAAPRLELTNADINVIVAPWLAIPEYGFGGWTYNRSVAHISINPWSPRFREPEREQRLGATLAHELHHLARNRNPASGWSQRMGGRGSLGGALLNEGLAQHFEEEMGFPCPFYATAVQRERLWDLGTRAMADFETPEFDYDAWFFGRQGDPAFPRHGGYALGYAIVRAWMMTSETTASEELGLEPKEVLAAWRSGQLDI